MAYNMSFATCVPVNDWLKKVYNYTNVLMERTPVCVCVVLIVCCSGGNGSTYKEHKTTYKRFEPNLHNGEVLPLCQARENINGE